MIAGDAVLPAGIHQHSRSLDIGIQEHLRVLDGTVYMTLRREIHHHIRMLFFKQPIHCLPVCDALLHESEIRVIHHRFKRRQISRISQAVQTDDPVIRVLAKHVKYKVTSDKSGSAGHYNIHNHSPFCFVNIVRPDISRPGRLSDIGHIGSSSGSRTP